MIRKDIFALAEEHSREVWGGEDEIGEGHLVLERFGIDPNEATELRGQLFATSSAAIDPNPLTQTALILQGLIFGLWLSEQQ